MDLRGGCSLDSGEMFDSSGFACSLLVSSIYSDKALLSLYLLSVTRVTLSGLAKNMVAPGTEDAMWVFRYHWLYVMVYKPLLGLLGPCGHVCTFGLLESA